MPNAKEIKQIFEKYLESYSFGLKIQVQTKNLILKEEQKQRNK
jgi:hypothetical protein